MHLDMGKQMKMQACDGNSSINMNEIGVIIYGLTAKTYVHTIKI